MAGLLLLLMLILSACAAVGDNPAENPTPSTITPASPTSDSSAPISDPPASTSDSPAFTSDSPAPAAPAVNDGSKELDADGVPVAESDRGISGDEKATVQDGTPNETRDPEVPLSDLPAPTLDPPKYPDPEPVIPPPRD